jgi:hypothetical protein
MDKKIVQFPTNTIQKPISNSDYFITLNPSLAPQRWKRMSDIGYEITSESKIELVVEE